jgi:GTP-binding protein Era
VTVELEDVPDAYRAAVLATLEAVGVADGHLAVEIVDSERIRELNREHRGKDEPTDVLSFPIDEEAPDDGPRELGDVVICPEHTADMTEAAVHGVLHLCGYDHETDDGEMLALQAKVLAGLEVPSTRAGFVGLAGRPNVGKSTLANAVVGSKVAIVSDRPQTTRRAIRAVATAPDASWQTILIDLPGVQKPRDVLTERMQRRVEHELADADVVLLILNGEQGVGPGDRFIADTLLGTKGDTPVICAVNKIDRLNKPQTVEVLAAAGELDVVDEVFPISARRGTGVDALLERLAELMPEGPLLYEQGQSSDQASEVHIAELIREQILRRTREEIPHAVEVDVTEIAERKDGLIEIRADVWAESDSQKAILIGKRGQMVLAVGKAARKEIERDLGVQVFLDLQVKVRSRWRRDEGLLDRLGIE